MTRIPPGQNKVPRVLLRNKPKKFKLLRRLAKLLLALGIITSVSGYLVVQNIKANLPTVSVLKDLEFQTPLRVFSADGKLMAEFGEKRRIPIELADVPKNLINAVIAIEDNRFFEHSGVDVIGLGRAVVKLIAKHEKSQGGSTITMQVARNFFLTREKTYLRKLNEILLAVKIENHLSKEEILSLYLNKIFFGYRSYGVAAAAKTYYGKELHQLTLAESAMIAGIPKAPSAVNPLSNVRAAIARRDHVLARMLHYGYITPREYQTAVNSRDTATRHEINVELNAPYVTEMVRQALVARWGEDVYTAGLQIHTTIDSRLQNYANQATKNAILQYEQRHGYNGPIDNWGQPTNDTLSYWLKKLREVPHVNDLEAGAVIEVTDNYSAATESPLDSVPNSDDPELNTNNNPNNLSKIKVLTSNNQIITIDWDGLSWARRKNKNLFSSGLSKRPSKASDVAKIGDIIKVWHNPNTNKWMLSQVPEIEAALVSIDPKSGKLLAISGGYDFSKSKFNRVTQAYRQAGSSLKPFVYSAALEKGFTPTSIFNDAPIVINDPEQEALWRPQNSTQEFYGPTRLRTALVKSRNLVSIRLLQEVGIEYTHDFLQLFGFNSNQIPSSLSLALGTASVTPLQLAQGFSTFANGGYAVSPTLIDKITNGSDQLLYQFKESASQTDEANKTTPNLEFYETANTTHKFKQIIPPQNAYLITNILQDAIKNGTGKKALELHRSDIAGKTGTSSDNNDAWYCGYNPSLVTVVWMGYDQPKNISEYAASTALPMWMDFMGKALQNKPEETPPMPNGLVSVRIDPRNGLLADSTVKDSIFEIFKEGTEPTEISSLETDNADVKTTVESAEQIF